MKIRKKTWPKLFKEIKNGNKKFDLRLCDFKCKKKDTIVFEEFDPKKNKYTGRKIEKKVTFVLKTKKLNFWNKKEIDKYGFIVMSLD